MKALWGVSMPESAEQPHEKNKAARRLEQFRRSRGQHDVEIAEDPSPGVDESADDENGGADK